MCIFFFHVRYTLFFSFEALSQKTTKASVGFVTSVRLSVHLSACLFVRPSVRMYRLDSQRTEIHEILFQCISLTFVARVKFCSIWTNRTDTVHAGILTFLALEVLEVQSVIKKRHEATWMRFAWRVIMPKIQGGSYLFAFLCRPIVWPHM